MESTLDLIINLFIAIVLIIGGYQLYFLPQRNPYRKAKSFVPSMLDELIPFNSNWVWIYSGLYYPGILGLVFSISNFRLFNYTAASFLILLIFQLFCFYFFPVKTPEHWRNYIDKRTVSMKFLRFIHTYDSPLNCFPSMHVSVATLAALHIENNVDSTYGIAIYLFPILIALSCLFTKQHYLIDLPAGVALGSLVFSIFKFII